MNKGEYICLNLLPQDLFWDTFSSLGSIADLITLFTGHVCHFLPSTPTGFVYSSLLGVLGIIKRFYGKRLNPIAFAGNRTRDLLHRKQWLLPYWATDAGHFKHLITNAVIPELLLNRLSPPSVPQVWRSCANYSGREMKLHNDREEMLCGVTWVVQGPRCTTRCLPHISAGNWAVLR